MSKNQTPNTKTSENTCTCKLCGFTMPWESHDYIHGDMWECDMCGKNFCTNCFVSDLGRKKFDKMWRGEGYILCPDCFRTSEAEDRNLHKVMREKEMVRTEKLPEFPSDEDRQATLSFLDEDETEEYRRLTDAIQAVHSFVPGLSSELLQSAYVLQQHINDILNIKNEIENSEEDYAEEYNLVKKPITNSEYEAIAIKLRTVLNSDLDIYWPTAAENAIRTVLEPRCPYKYVISRVINGVTINGDEYALNDDGSLMLFDTIDLAIKYLYSKGITAPLVEGFTVVGLKIDEDGNIVEKPNGIK